MLYLNQLIRRYNIPFDSFCCKISDIIASLCIKSIHILDSFFSCHKQSCMTIHGNIMAFPIHKRNYQVFFCMNKVTYSLLFDCNGVQREHNKKLNNGLPILHKVPPK